MGIGRRIKEARERAGLTQEELAKRVGVTGSAITNYEKETSHPKEAIMYALIDELGVDANYLFQDCVKIKQSPSTTEIVPEECDVELVEYLRKGLISLGFINDGEDITANQRKILLAACQIIQVAFGDSK